MFDKKEEENITIFSQNCYLCRRKNYSILHRRVNALYYIDTPYSPKLNDSYYAFFIKCIPRLCCKLL